MPQQLGAKTWPPDMRTPVRGDIWFASLDPSLGHEQQDMRPVLVVSPQEFNRLGLCVVCPITHGGQQTRFAGFAVTLMGASTQTQGVVMCNQPRTVDLAARCSQFVEAVATHVVEEVLGRLQSLFE